MCKNKTELNQLVKKYRKLRREQEQLDALLSDVKEEIKDYVREHGELDDSVSTKPIIFCGVDYKLLLLTITKDNIDTKLLKSDLGADQYSKYNHPSMYESLRIS